MQIDFTALTNVNLTDNLRQLTIEKLHQLERRDGHISRVRVTFKIDKLSHIAEAHLHTRLGDIHARGEAENMRTAIDKLAAHMTRQLDKQKDKQITQKTGLNGIEPDDETEN